MIATDEVQDIEITGGGKTIKTSSAELRRVVRELELSIPDPADMLGMYQAAPELTALADELRERHGLPSDYRLDVLWRKKGGKARGGRRRFGKVVLVSDLAGHYASADVVIWLAADNCLEAEYGPDEIERELFHQLCAIALEPKSLTPMVMPPDFAAYKRELDTYGLWRPSLEEAADAFAQARLGL